MPVHGVLSAQFLPGQINARPVKSEEDDPADGERGIHCLDLRKSSCAIGSVEELRAVKPVLQ